MRFVRRQQINRALSADVGTKDNGRLVSALDKIKTYTFKTYDVTTGMTLTHMSLFKNAQDFLDTISYVATVVENQERFHDPKYKVLYEQASVNKCFVDNWLVDNNGRSVDIRKFHHSVTTNYIKVLALLQQLKSTGSKLINYYTRYLTGLQSELYRWHIVVKKLEG